MKRIALLFPGQGSQYAGMGEKLYRDFSKVRDIYEQANDILEFDLRKLSFEGPMEELTKTENTQPALLTAGYAAFIVLTEELNCEPAILCGHSLGEITALTCAGGIRFYDALKIVRKRGRFMQEAAAEATGAMAAISGLDRASLEAACREHSAAGKIVVVSNRNSAMQTVVSGHKDAVNSLCQALSAKKIMATKLNVSAPFHSPLMQPAAEKMQHELGLYQFLPLKYPVLANVDAKPYASKEIIPDNLVRQITSPVEWEASMLQLVDWQIDLAIEAGPKTVLKNLMKNILPALPVYASDQEDVLNILKDELKQKAPITPLKFLGRCLAMAAATRNRNFDNEAYQRGVLEPYQQIRQLQETLEKENREPAESDLKASLDMLRIIFKTKQVPDQEQAERLRQIIKEANLDHLFPDLVKTPMEPAALRP